ncbi:MAG: CDP-alcohol phosphatidyltransferase family protein [Clostridia bacterium]|nr:CDP-alcohol phosphatidyltransferase family protein [Clostridia bacterium]
MDNQKLTFTEQVRKTFKSVSDGCARFLLNMGLTANMVTIIGCVGHLIPLGLVYKGHFVVAALLLTFFSLLDWIDGAMARMATGGKGTEFGAVLDSTTDRYAEFLILGGILLYYATRGSMLWVTVSIVAMMGSFIVPYTRAKGEIYGLNMKLGIMSRMERYIALIFSLLIGYPYLSVALIAVFANITVIQRLLYMKKNLK